MVTVQLEYKGNFVFFFFYFVGLISPDEIPFFFLKYISGVFYIYNKGCVFLGAGQDKDLSRLSIF